MCGTLAPQSSVSLCTWFGPCFMWQRPTTLPLCCSIFLALIRVLQMHSPIFSSAGFAAWPQTLTPTQLPPLFSRLTPDSTADPPPGTWSGPFYLADLQGRSLPVQTFLLFLGHSPMAHLTTDIAVFLYPPPRSVSHGTLLVYLAAIHYHHLQQGLGDPLSQQPLLCKGIKRHQGTCGRMRLPLSASLLLALHPHLQQSPNLGRMDQLAVWAALTLAFHAFLRASEFTSPTTSTYSPRRHPLRRDIHQEASYLTITIKPSKGDPFRAACTLPVTATGTATCPVRAMRRFLSQSNYPASRPLFTLSSGKFLTRPRLTTILWRLLQATGMSKEHSHLYGSHSLCIGAATDVGAAGLPNWLIQARCSTITSAP